MATNRPAKTRPWLYTRTETVEIQVPATITSDYDFLDWLSDHPDSRSAQFQVLDTVVSDVIPPTSKESIE